MDLSGFRETISTLGKIFPDRSRMVGSVSGKFIIVPRIKTLSDWAPNWANPSTNSRHAGGGRSRSKTISLHGRLNLIAFYVIN